MFKEREQLFKASAKKLLRQQIFQRAPAGHHSKRHQARTATVGEEGVAAEKEKTSRTSVDENRPQGITFSVVSGWTPNIRPYFKNIF